MKMAKFVTTKEDTESHGYGLKNVESAAEKYDGICQLHHNDVYLMLRWLCICKKAWLQNKNKI